MDKKPADGCAKPAAGVIGGATGDAETGNGQESQVKEETKVQARVGYEAPDFELTAYHKGEFKNVRLSDHRGKWILLCFYPGDFTFV
jgi:peroxiredoxin (alkyl hydroperoxide reductase subunit C)